MIQIFFLGDSKLNLSSSHTNFKGLSRIRKFPYDSLLKQIAMQELRILHTRCGNKTWFFLPGCNRLCPHQSYLKSLDAFILMRFGNRSMIISTKYKQTRARARQLRTELCTTILEDKSMCEFQSHSRCTCFCQKSSFSSGTH